MFTTNEFSMTLGVCIIGYLLVYWTIKRSRSIPKGSFIILTSCLRKLMSHVQVYACLPALQDCLSLATSWKCLLVANGIQLQSGVKSMVRIYPVVKKQGVTEDFTGDLVYLNVLGTRFVYVNSFEAAHELFERRSSLYADRPDQPMMSLFVPNFPLCRCRFMFLAGQGGTIFSQSCHMDSDGDNIVEHFTSTSTLPGLPSIIQCNSNTYGAPNPLCACMMEDLMIHSPFLKRIHNSPDDFVNHLRQLAAAIIMEVNQNILFSRSSSHNEVLFRW